MSIVKSVTIYSSRVWLDGVKRRYEITLTDEQGLDHTKVLGVFKVPESDTGAEIADKYLASQKNSEVEQYKEAVSEGVNPFLKDSLWNNRAELLLPILTDALTLPATESLVINGLPYLELVTDDELMALFSKDQTWVDDVRVKAATLLSGKAVIDAYEAVGI